MTLPDNYPQMLRKEGLTVVEMPNWRSVGRPPSTGTAGKDGDLMHHTGSSDKVPESEKDDYAYAKWLFEVGRPDLPPPLANTSIGRDGTVYVGAAGRANHAGKAKASGPMPAGDGNAIYRGHEAQNNGTEGWGKAQYEAMVKVAYVGHLIDGHGAAARRGHKETSVTGKWDPGGMDMARFRADVAAYIEGRKTPKMGPVAKARVQIHKAIANAEQAIEHLKEAGPSRPVAYAQRIPLREAVNLMKGVLRALPAVKKP